MNPNFRQRTHLILYIFAIIGIGAMIYSIFSPFFGGGLTSTVHAQQDPFLAQRLTQIEQRFSLIESRLTQIEIQSRFPAASSNLPSVQDTELRLLRAQIDALQLRIAETECGLLSLDERTLSNAARQALKNSDTAGKRDICRETPNVPLQLSARP